MRDGLLDGILSMGSSPNKVNPENEFKEGVGELTPELSLSTDDDELVRLSDEWSKGWELFNTKLSKRQEDNEKYWLGKFKYSDLETQSLDRPAADNLIFEGLETFLPLATRQNPEPTVECEDVEEASVLTDELKRLSDVLKFKLKIREVTRHWALYFVGVGKIAYDLKDNRITFNPLRPQRIIMDPDATIEGGIYNGRYLGELKTEKASEVVAKFPKKAEYIKKKVEGKMATQITYTEWWCDDYLFWRLDKEILDKAKNPHWNYEENVTKTDEFGAEVEATQEGLNHFKYPQKPYAFLSIFNIGKHPVDDTSLISQNLYIQDSIHARYEQLNANVDNINGGWVVSGKESGLTKDEAARAIEAIKKGGAVYTPSGNATNAIAKVNGDGLPGDVYNNLVDMRNELRNIFGVRGSSSQGAMSEQTVRGKIIGKSGDDSRVSLIAEYIEQFSDYVYNWFVQMMYVYYPEEFKAKLTVEAVISVKEGSLIPKDPLMKRNEAIDLWSTGAISPEDLYKALDNPDPDGMAQRLKEWLAFKANPILPGQGMMPGQEMLGPEQMAEQQAIQQVPLM
jgi:hypothetical protein